MSLSGTDKAPVAHLIWIVSYIGFGFLVEALINHLFIARYFMAGPESDGAEMSALDKVMGGVIRAIPGIVGLLVFFSTSYFAFMFFTWTESGTVQLVFLSLLIAIASIRLTAIVCRIIFFPSFAAFRVVPIGNNTARLVHRFFACTVAWWW